MYRIYTRTGDKGTTALYGGSRIEKDHIRVEAYGTVDELISQLGVCYATTRDEEDITALERLIDRNMAESGPLKQFVIPGKNLASAQLHVARTQSRRLERLLTAMDRVHPLRDALKRYSNRLSDALFSMARIEETRPDACA